MKLSLKLPLAFAAALLLVSGAALYGIQRLNQSLHSYATTVQASVGNELAANELSLAFKTQIQEWKNTLIRGKDPEALDKYWSAFSRLEQEIGEKSRRLAAVLPQDDARTLLARFSASHAAMSTNYRKGFDAFKAAGFDASAGDTAVKGMDRDASALLEQVAQAISADSAAEAARAATDGSRAIFVSIVLMLIAFAAGLFGALMFSRTITVPIGQAVSTARAVASGDLTQRLDAVGDDETGQLLLALKEMQTGLAAVVSNVRRNSDAVAIAATQIAQGNNDLSHRTEVQASALQETAASMEDFRSAAKQSADNARQANQLALGASAVAIKGGNVVGQVVDTMKGINDSSKKIAEIISVIDGITFQTNILALNAAVEAARAGEHGRGFAVVASEVRNLAGRSAEAAREINNLITASVARVEQGTALVDEAGSTMTDVVQAIGRVTEIMSLITTASNEQSAGVAQISETIAELDRTTQQNSAMVEESAAAAGELRNQATQLVEAVSAFRVA